MALRVDSHRRSKAKLVAGLGTLVATLLSSDELAYALGQQFFMQY